MSDEKVPYKIPTMGSASSPANVAIVGGPTPSFEPSVSPEVERCSQAYINAYMRAKIAGIPADDCALAAKLSFEAEWQLQIMLLKPLANPKGLPA